MPVYVRAALHAFQHRTPKKPQDSPYPWTQPIYGEKNQMLSLKAPAEELDGNNKKIFQKIVGKFLYYSRAIYPTMLKAPNSMAAVQTNPTIETAKQITQFLNYIATRSDAIIEYRKSGMILHIYSDASHISETEAPRRAKEYFS